jgi:hypothetical protein
VIDNSEDHVKLEQELIDTYVLFLNLNRFATSAPRSNPTPYVPLGADNPQFGNTGPESPVWDRKHSPEQIASWSVARSTSIFVYDVSSLTLYTMLSGLTALATFLDVHVNTARRALRSGKITAKKWILSTVELKVEALKIIVQNQTGKPPVFKNLCL